MLATLSLNEGQGLDGSGWGSSTTAAASPAWGLLSWAHDAIAFRTGDQFPTEVAVWLLAPPLIPVF